MGRFAEPSDLIGASSFSWQAPTRISSAATHVVCGRRLAAAGWKTNHILQGPSLSVVHIIDKRADRQLWEGTGNIDSPLNVLAVSR